MAPQRVTSSASAWRQPASVTRSPNNARARAGSSHNRSRTNGARISRSVTDRTLRCWSISSTIAGPHAGFHRHRLPQIATDGNPFAGLHRGNRIWPECDWRPSDPLCWGPTGPGRCRRKAGWFSHCVGAPPARPVPPQGRMVLTKLKEGASSVTKQDSCCRGTWRDTGISMKPFVSLASRFLQLCENHPALRRHRFSRRRSTFGINRQMRLP